jgi:hypothetical protein
MFSQTIKRERPHFRATLRGYVSPVASFLASLRDGFLRKRKLTRQCDAVSSTRAPMQAIVDRRQKLEAQIEAAARQGFIQDGLAMCLLDNFYEELAERRRLLTELEHALQAVMRRLEAMAPPPKPEPEPRPELRKRRFTNFRDWLSGTPGLAK